jgi:hypothetical protein
LSKLSEDRSGAQGAVPGRPTGPDRLERQQLERLERQERQEHPHHIARPHHLPSPDHPGRPLPSVGGRYRSLREMSTTPPVDTPPPKPGDAAHPLHGLHGPDEEPARRRRWTRRRLTVAGVLLAAILLIVGTGGYLGFRLVAPAFGLGYHTGGRTTLDNGITLTVTFVHCGINNAPNGSGARPSGSYCTVEVSGFSAARQGVFVDLRDWHADLDVGIDNVTPSSAAMKRSHDVLLGSRTYQLVYDVPTGARLTEVHFRVGNATGFIKVS